MMKAIVTPAYGSEEVLEVREIARPAVGEGEILVKIQACSVNPIDWRVRRGDFKLLTGRKPPQVPGNDFTGEVAHSSLRLENWKPGDRVWGFVEDFQRGTYAEYIAVKKEEFGPAPQGVHLEESASLPTAGLTAYQALVQIAKIHKGDQILINGCTGGVGSAALQIAKAYGCKVTGVTSTDHLEAAEEMGADRVIDYRREDVVDLEGRFELFFDVVPNRSFREVRHLLAERGMYITTLPTISTLIFAPVLNLFRKQKAKTFDSKPSREDLDTLRSMVEEGTLVPVVDQVFPLEQAATAQRISEHGSVVGKLVLRMPE